MKKGQLTIFIIVGLALLLIIGLFLIKPDVIKPTSLQAKQDAAKVTQFTQSCLNTLGESTLREIGMNGGYRDMSALKQTANVRDTQVINFPPQKIPLWHEIHTCGTNPSGCIGNNRPPLCSASERSCPIPKDPRTNPDVKSLQEQLEKGIEAQIDSCLDFTSFQEMTVEKTGVPKVHATIREKDILLAMDYPMTVTTANKEIINIKDSSATLQVALPELYRFAIKLQETEIRVGFLETTFLQLLTVHSGLETPLPPISDVEMFGDSNKFWIRTNVQDVIEQDLLPQMDFVQIVNAPNSFYPITETDVDPRYAPYANGLYQSLLIKIDNTTVPYEVSFEYPNSPMFLDINGKELLKPQKIVGGALGDIISAMTGISFAQYKFKYTASFPMIVHLSDTDAFNGKGYNLDFGIEANIKNNYPLNTSITPAVLRGTRSRLDLSDPSQLVNHTYTIKVTDRHTKAPIKDATVQYQCDVRYYLGVTGADGTWTGKMPYCMSGGSVTAQLFRYVGSAVDVINTEDDGGRSTVEVALWPRRQKLVSLYKRTPEDVKAIIAKGLGFGDMKEYRTNLTLNDSSMLQIARVKENEAEEDVPLAGMLQFGGPQKSAISSGTEIEDSYAEALKTGSITQAQYDEAMTQYRAAQREEASRPAPPQTLVQNVLVDLVPGKYTVNNMLMFNGGVNLPLEVRCEGGSLFRSCTEIKFEAKNYSVWISGGAILDGEEQLELTENDIYSDKNITFYALEIPIPKTWREFTDNYQDITKYQTYEKKPMVRPEIE